MSTNPYESPETVGYAPPRKTWRPSLISLLVAIAIIGALVALLLPNVRSSRGVARQIQCQNNLRQIAQALRNYEEVYHALPPAYTVDTAGKPLHSWRTLILPFAGEKALYDRIDLAKPWDDPVNQSAAEASPQFYYCPSNNLPKGQTTYLAIVAPGGCFRLAEPRALKEISDDAGLTLMVIEVADKHAVHWMSPSDASEVIVLSLGADPKPAHQFGVQAACVDGGVRFLSKKTSPDTLRALISIAGNDDRAAENH